MPFQSKGDIVMLRSMYDNLAKKDISQEPEMQELKRMFRDGELDQGRTVKHLKKEKGKSTEMTKGMVFQICSSLAYL